MEEGDVTHYDGHSTHVTDVRDDEATGVFSRKDVFTSSTDTSSLAVWTFLQFWFKAFPKYLPETAGFHLFTESYGGHYGPSIADILMSKNQAIKRNEINGTIIDMQTLGIGNGYIDSIIQFPYGPLMWVSNSYGMSNLVFHADDRTATDDLAFANAMRGFLTPGECKSLMQECRIHKDPQICRGTNLVLID
jgi:carboxypeptidase C (cathepsin A)